MTRHEKKRVSIILFNILEQPYTLSWSLKMYRKFLKKYNVAFGGMPETLQDIDDVLGEKVRE